MIYILNLLYIYICIRCSCGESKNQPFCDGSVSF
ncbi:MAG: CDGSH iron-sulfur domain-containing protein [Paenibacillus sp.]|nr:CDGSH iron-sulfur domain-containing protein [Paenibacillus sp.]